MCVKLLGLFQDHFRRNGWGGGWLTSSINANQRACADFRYGTLKSFTREPKTIYSIKNSILHFSKWDNEGRVSAAHCLYRDLMLFILPKATPAGRGKCSDPSKRGLHMTFFHTCPPGWGVVGRRFICLMTASIKWDFSPPQPFLTDPFTHPTFFLPPKRKGYRPL